MANYAKWRAVSTALADESDRWDAIDDAARVLWLQLLLLSDNYGAMDADPYIVWRSCTQHLGWDRDKTADALDTLAAAGLIHRYDTKKGPWLHLTDFDEHQHYEYLRKRGPRKGPTPPCMTGESGCQPSLLNDEGRPMVRRHKDKDKDKNKDKNNTVEGAGAVREVFDHWVKVDVETGGGNQTGRILNASRRDKIQARLNEGYTVDQLKQAITAFCNDPWHRGKNDRKTRYTGLVTLLKTGEKVEAGLRMAEAATTRTEHAGAGYVRPQVIV